MAAIGMAAIGMAAIGMAVMLVGTRWNRPAALEGGDQEAGPLRAALARILEFDALEADVLGGDVGQAGELLGAMVATDAGEGELLPDGFQLRGRFGRGGIFSGGGWGYLFWVGVIFPLIMLVYYY